MKKRIFSLIASALATLVLLAAFTACSNDSGKDTEDSIYSVKYNGKTVELGTSEAKMTEKWGQPPTEPQDVGACGDKGTVVNYDYRAISVSVVKYNDGKSEIDTIELRNDSAETSKGLYIGSDESDIERLYGTPSSDKNGVIKYENENNILEITVKDGKVNTIVMRVK